MDSPKIVAKTEYDRLLAEFLEKSQAAFQRMFAPDQQEHLITFTEREDRAVELGEELANWLVVEHAAADVAAEPSKHQHACHCPKCGKLGRRRTKPEAPLPQRSLVSRAGSLELEREEWECTICRIVFFPLGPENEARSRGI